MQSFPVCLPKLPPAEAIFPYLQQIDANRWYSNYGPLCSLFHSRLAELFKVDTQSVCSASNGTLLLELCLKAFNLPENSLCILPSWTFVATPLAVVNAQLKPYFVDVDLSTQTILPEQLEKQLATIQQHGNIGAVIVVAPFGMPVHSAAWDAFTERTGIPVIIDAAAAFDSVLSIEKMRVGKTPTMISLHATKVLGIGEGAVLFSTQTDLVKHIVELTQFGFPLGVRDAKSLGTNAKISEYAAAVGLAALDCWPATRAGWDEVGLEYQVQLNAANISHLLAPDWVASTCNIIVPQLADKFMQEFAAKKIQTRKWWGDGCHHQSIFQFNLKADLVNTDYLQKSVLGLPFYLGMKKQEIEFIVGQLLLLLSENQMQVISSP